MRIIAGEYASRRIDAPKGTSTRPTLDKVKEAVFSSLGTYFDGGVFLDLYAGSGANGLEALSRGVEFVYFVDVNGQAISTIQHNITTLNCKENTKVLKMPDFKALQYFADHDIQFDYVYLDPPYQKQQNYRVLEFLDTHHLMKPNGVIIIESLKEETYTNDYPTLKYIKDKEYGISRITYYHCTAVE